MPVVGTVKPLLVDFLAPQERLIWERNLVERIEKPAPVSSWIRMTGCIIIAALNGFFAYYVVIFGGQKVSQYFASLSTSHTGVASLE